MASASSLCFINKVGVKAQNTDYHTWIKNGINFIRNLPERLTDQGFEEKQTIIGSIFPEKLQFDGKKVRTAFFNEALFHFLSIDKGYSIIKKGQLNKNIKLSYKAALIGSSSKRFLERFGEL